jgi:TonB family protein
LEQAPKATARSIVAKDVEPAELKTYFPPFYPLSLRMEGVEGRIDLQFDIDATGAVTEVSVLNATAPQFREYALEAGSLWEFFPALRAGEPVPIAIVIPVQFISEFGSGELLPNSPLVGLTYLNGSYYTSDANGRFQPANLPLTPLARSQPYFKAPAGNKEAVKATLMFTVTDEGRVLNPEVVETTNEDFGKAAMTAVRFWQFIPRIKNGKAVSSQVQLPIVFGSEGAAD